ncbi:MAG: transcriptional regulator PpsR [Pseudomonadota bacterium]
MDANAHTLALQQAADFTMLLDGDGIISRVYVASDELQSSIDASWEGKLWLDTATPASRQRLENLLAEAAAQPGDAAQGDAVHPLPDGSELPIQYRAICQRDIDETLIFGHDLRPLATLRQQLLNAQQALEQDYWRLRQVETRYRRLFDMVDDAVLVVDDASGRVLEANPAADKLLGGGKSLVGRPLQQGLDARSVHSVEKLLEETRSLGNGSLAGVFAKDSGQRLSLSASFLRQDGESRFLLRVAGPDDAESGVTPGEHYMQETLRMAPDAVLLTDIDGRVVAANKAFLDLAQLSAEEQVKGHSADRWLGRSGVDLSVLLTNLREHDVVRLFATTLRGESGTRTDVEISARSLSDLQEPMIAFFIRDIGRRIGIDHPMGQQLPRSIEQVTQRVGRVPLKELVRESKDVIEALCIEAALKLTHDNRASAAELLGLSRQSLYAKLRRHGSDGVDNPTGDKH